MSKPCDRYEAELPCREPGYAWCLGPLHWEHRSFRNGEREKLDLAMMDRCPWERQVRAWLDKKGLLGRVNRLQL